MYAFMRPDPVLSKGPVEAHSESDPVPARAPPRTMCNKLRCGNCDKPFCIVCLHPSSTMSHLADHAGCARLFALSR